MKERDKTMKEMIYKRERIIEILHSGEYFKHKFVIISLGTHPVAYIECKLQNCNSYDDERLKSIEVHGGFTYFGEAHWDENDNLKYLGWDYSHCGDYNGTWNDVTILPNSVATAKKYTTEEIFEEVKRVISQLMALENDENNLNKHFSEWTLKEIQEYCNNKENKMCDISCPFCSICREYAADWDLKELDELQFKKHLTESELAICKAAGAKWLTKDKKEGFHTVALWKNKPQLNNGAFSHKNDEFSIACFLENVFPSVANGDCICVE